MGAIFKPLRAESDELLHLDFMRFIAASAIVVLHGGGGFEIGGRTHVPPDTLALMVDLFFTISGFVIAYVYHDRMGSVADYGAFLKRRAARLLPLHWAMLLLFVAVGVAVHHGLPTNFPERYRWDCLAPNALLVQAVGTCPNISFNGVSWSISAEMVMYVLCPAFLMLLGRGVWVIAAATALAFLGVMQMPHWYLEIAPWGVLRALPSFMLGVTFYGLRHQLAKIPYAPVLFGLGVVTYFAGVFAGWGQVVLMPLVYAIVACAIGADISGRVSGVVRKLAPLGQLTYSVYMIHFAIILGFVDVIAERVLHLHGTVKNLAVLVTLIAPYPVAYLSLMLFETPARRWITRLKLPVRRPIPAPAE